MRRAWIAVVSYAACAACADLSGLADGPGFDAGPGTTKKDSGARTDGGPAGPPDEARCDPSKPFGSHEVMSDFDVTSSYTKGAVVSHDELEVFYLRYSGSNWELRRSTRTNRNDKWGSITTQPLTPSPDGFLSLTASSKKLYFWTISSNYRTTRTAANDVFSAPEKFDVASGPWPFIVAADDVAYFAKYEGDGAPDRVLMRGSVTTSGFSYQATAVPNLHVAGSSDSRPVLNVSETTIYFSSNRPGGRGLDDIWVARRASKQDEFGTPTHVAELSTDEPDAVTWVSDDDCQIFIDRASHIYLARRGQ